MTKPDFLPQTAMVLAAGLGKRMRPITDTLPKPLVKVAGKPLLDWGLDHLAGAGVKKAVVNVHYLADQIETHLSNRNGLDFKISDERERLLESGGGIIKALPLIGREPFFLINSDTFWLDEARPILSVLPVCLTPPEWTSCSCLRDTIRQTGHGDKSDFIVGPDSRLARYTEVKARVTSTPGRQSFTRAFLTINFRSRTRSTTNSTPPSQPDGYTECPCMAGGSLSARRRP